MRDLRGDLDDLWHEIGRLRQASRTPSIAFVAAHGGEGTTSIAASFAMMAAERAERNAWLVDLDLRRNMAFRGFRAGRMSRFGLPGRAYDASLRAPQIYTVRDGDGPVTDGKLLTVHGIENTSLMVTRFRNERLEAGAKVNLRSQPQWWAALRQITDWIVVDMPALERSAAALTTVNAVDGVVLVVNATQTRRQEVASLRRDVELRGGRVAGVVLNRER